MKVLLLLLVLLFPAVSYADSDDFFTLGVGGNIGAMKTDRGYWWIGEAKADARLAALFGGELSYGPREYRIAGVLHAIPTRPLGCYVKFGAWAKDTQRINFRKRGSYYVGLGVNYYLGKHAAFNLDGYSDLRRQRMNLSVGLSYYF